jgi:hypothetical protein
MNTPTRLAAFALVLGLALGGGALVGNAAGPVASDDDEMDEHGSDAGTSAAAPAQTTEADDMPAGVLIAQDGYTLDADTTALDPGAPGPFRFRILGPDGQAVEDFEVSHEKELHLIVVGTDLATYAHLHPTLGDDGTWSVELPALSPGVYRAYADFAVADGPELTLGVDLTVAGEARFAPLPEPVATAEVDGYEVTLTGTPVAGASSDLTLTVRRDGEPVTDVEPYLGAFGHLVAIRGGDLAYLHVHPHGDEVTDPDARGGPEVSFAVEVPSPGSYRLFFDFQHDGEVRTAAFTVEVAADGSAPTETPAHDDSDDEGGHG